jgi:hypothetical protein
VTSVTLVVKGFLKHRAKEMIGKVESGKPKNSAYSAISAVNAV